MNIKKVVNITRTIDRSTIIISIFAEALITIISARIERASLARGIINASRAIRIASYNKINNEKQITNFEIINILILN